MEKISILFSVLLLSLTGLSAQKFPEKGVPLIDSYTPGQYGEAGKVWNIRSAPNGIVYFATNKGLLEFDGQHWQRFPGSKGFTRSLLLASDTFLYSGADKDFGYWERNERRQFEFTSLYPFRESAKGLNEEFWGAHRIDGDIVFASFDNIYVYKDRQLTKIAAPSRFTGSFFAGDRLYLPDEANGLYEFDGLNLNLVFRHPMTSPAFRIVGVQEDADGLLLVTRNQGLLRYRQGELTAVDSEVSGYLQRDQVFCFTPIDDTHYAFGTILNGVYITDRAGNIIQHINKPKGLPNNTVLSLHYSRRGRLWVGMDFGLAAIHLRSDLSYVLDQRGQFGTAQTALLREGVFYLGTNQGLYTTAWDNLQNDARETNFTLVPGSSGQVWDLRVIEGDILCGHDKGLFRVGGNEFIRLHDEPGVLTIQPLEDGQILTGNYNGVSLFSRVGDTWVFEKKIPPIQGACDQLDVLDADTLWVNIPNFGLIRATLGAQYTVTDQQIFPASDFAGTLPQLYRDSAGIQVVTNEYIYTYQPDTQSFAQVAERRTHHQIQNILPGAYRPKPLDPTHGFFPVFNGFALLNSNPGEAPFVDSPLTIRSLTVFSNDTTRLIPSGARVPYALNNLRVRYIVPQQEQVLYRHRLAPSTAEWSPWSTRTQIEFIHLQEGRYTLSIQAKVGERGADTQQVRFRVAPPWYRTWWAYGAYVLLVAGLFYLNHQRQNSKLRKQRQQLLEQEQEALRQQAESYQQERLLKKQATLEEELKATRKQLRRKTIELAKKAKENQDKQRLLQTLKEKIEATEKESTLPKASFRQVKNLLNTSLDAEDDTFDLQMEELHQEFLTKLHDRYPDLTTYDLRLSAYLKSGLNTREIAGIMNVLPSSVNVSRSRLRKKLQLDSREDLFRFLNNLD